MTYRDRAAAGEALADVLGMYADRPEVLALGLARGGMAVAAPVARRLHIGLDVLVIRKLGLPTAPEVAFGAVGPSGVEVRDRRLAGGIGSMLAERIAKRARAEVRRREAAYRSGRPPLSLAGRIALIIDDGLATGATAHAAIRVARTLGAHEVTMAAPVGAAEAIESLTDVADDVVCPLVPLDFTAVSTWYDDFDQVDDQEVMALLAS